LKYPGKGLHFDPKVHGLPDVVFSQRGALARSPADGHVGPMNVVTKLLARISLLLMVSFLGSGCGYNQVITEDEKVKAAWAEVQNQYQRRTDLVPNLVKTVKGAANFE